MQCPHLWQKQVKQTANGMCWTLRASLQVGVATEAARLLRGKHKVTFTPHVDCGDHVIIINCKEAILTGNKVEKKYYHHHTGWIQYLKSIRYDALMEKNPTKAMELAVKGMIPSNTMGREALTRLRLYAGAEHKHEAQQPTTWDK